LGDSRTLPTPKNWPTCNRSMSETLTGSALQILCIHIPEPGLGLIPCTSWAGCSG
jgi:hypothetical protein